MSHDHHDHGQPHDQDEREHAAFHGDAPEDWDQRYAEEERIWSGAPNQGLVAEAAALTPGRALDVGCGEGADAVWLAGRGWEVTALDVSQVALTRARLHAEQASVQVTWLQSGLTEATLSADGYDLVSVFYPALRHTPGHDAERALVSAVAPGGTLLVVHHADVDADHARESGFDPADYVGHEDVVGFLGDGWQVEVDDRRPRHVASGGGAHRHHDEVLRATRLG